MLPATPPAVGPYRAAVKAAGLLFVSGQIPINPADNSVIADDIVAATHQVMRNLKAVLASEGAGLQDVVKTTIYLVDMEQFATVNEIYAQYFTAPYPARACIAVAALPKGVPVEVEAVATMA